MNNDKILEALKMQPLTEEDKAKRHILGRLYGPIATSKESTRNGRKYNAELWDRQLNDEIFNEKIQTKALLLELGHPLDREETDMSKVCACIPELPKTLNGDLYAYVDILDTPNGKILKTLCDYGFVPGISSRGSGDIMENDEVDPETFFLETWDIVALPAVKKARLTVCESLDQTQLKLTKALKESFDKADEKDKSIMQEALNNLKINLLEDVQFADGDTAICTADGIVYNEEDNTQLNEADDVVEVEDEEVENEAEDTAEEVIDDAALIDVVRELGTAIADPDVSDEDVDNLINDKIEQGVGNVEFWKELTSVLTEIIGYSQEVGNNIEDEVADEDIVEVPADEVAEDEAEEPAEEAEDNGDEEVFESLKEAIRQKNQLEKELKSLKSEKTVSDTEVEKLQEELSKYKTAFTRVSVIAATARKSEAEVKSLTEQLNQKSAELSKKSAEITSLKKVAAERLNESAQNVRNEKQIQTLTEKLKDVTEQLHNTETNLTEQANSYKKQLNERTTVARQYIAKYKTILEQYVSFKASMLGVRPAEITSRLDKNFSVEDVNEVCDKMLTESVRINSVGLTGGKAKVQIQSQTKPTSKYDDDDLSDLYELAGLK